MKHAERKKMRSKIIPAFFLFFAIHAEAAETQLQYFAEGQATPQEMTLNKIRRKMYCRTPERARHVIRLEWLKSTSAPAVLGNESGECKNFLNWGTQKICETPANQEQIAALIQACTK